MPARGVVGAVAAGEGEGVFQKNVAQVRHAFEQGKRNAVDAMDRAQNVVGAVPEIGVDAVLDPDGRFGVPRHGLKGVRDLVERC